LHSLPPVAPGRMINQVIQGGQCQQTTLARVSTRAAFKQRSNPIPRQKKASSYY
jgi:hypothetical protein